MMKRAFTLIELLVVVAIMAMLGTMSVGGYRAMQRGMEDRGAMQNVNQFIRAAYQRAQIDRAPVAVYFWNETSAEEDEANDQMLVAHGHAVAIRRAGRISAVPNQELLCDEYGDLNYSKLIVNEDEDEESSDSGSTKAGGIYLYKVNGNEGSQAERSIISQTTRKFEIGNQMLLMSGGDVSMETYAYVLIDKNGVDWKTGDAYGFEFATLDLPDGYLFGSQYATSLSNPVKGEDVLRFKVSANSGSGAKSGTSGKSTVDVYCLRPGSSGTIEAQRVGSSESPTSDLQN